MQPMNLHMEEVYITIAAGVSFSDICNLQRVYCLLVAPTKVQAAMWNDGRK